MTAPLDACVLVTPRSFGVRDPWVREELERAVREVRYNDLGRPLCSDELCARLDGVDALLAGLDEIDEAVLSRPGLRVVARYGVGVDRVDLAAAERHGVAVCTTPGANAAAVAELTLALMLLLCRPVLAADRAVRAGAWPSLHGRELGARTVGIVGLGQIGARVARAVAALGATVLAHDPYVDEQRARELGVEVLGLEELVARAEILSLHMPGGEETRGIVDRALLARLPEGALLVNTARGDLVDEEALLWALDEGPLAGAALDALPEEPPREGHPLLLRDDVIVTSHIGAASVEASTRMARTAIAELLAVLEGRAPRFPLVPPKPAVEDAA